MVRAAASTNEVENQLHMFHDPFADTTSQPKIPDGKVTESLGVTFSYVGEASLNIAHTTDVMHMILFPGLSVNLIYEDGQTHLGAREYALPFTTGAPVADWSSFTTSGSDGQVASGDDDVAQWRTVSSGVQLKLLNSVEEDDGWWEAVRLVKEHKNTDWRLTTGDDSTNRVLRGAIAPAGLLNDTVLRNRSMANDPSYSTGLLRDLHRVQFELHGKKDHHDFTQGRHNVHIPSQATFAVDTLVDFETIFNDGHDEPVDAINTYVDSGMDMIYIRLHCRSAVSPSRFHVRSMNNLELRFDQSAREHRYQTKCHNIGVDDVSKHATVRSGDANAAKMSF